MTYSIGDEVDTKFPLIQLPRKSEDGGCLSEEEIQKVSINSTSEEVRSSNSTAIVGRQCFH